MKVFVVLLMGVFLCACAPRPHLEAQCSNSTATYSRSDGFARQADNGTCADGAEKKGEDDRQPDSVPKKMAKGVVAALILVGAAVLYVLTYVPLGGM